MDLKWPGLPRRRSGLLQDSSYFRVHSRTPKVTTSLPLARHGPTAHPFLIDLVRWLRKAVRTPPGLVRLQPRLVRLPSGLVRSFLVALAADARADGSASGTKRCILAKKPTRGSQAEESTTKRLQASLAPALPSFVPSCFCPKYYMVQVLSQEEKPCTKPSQSPTAWICDLVSSYDTSSWSARLKPEVCAAFNQSQKHKKTLLPHGVQLERNTGVSWRFRSPPERRTRLLDKKTVESRSLGRYWREVGRPPLYSSP